MGDTVLSYQPHFLGSPAQASYNIKNI